jgi:hypothetical protein
VFYWWGMKLKKTILKIFLVLTFIIQINSCSTYEPIQIQILKPAQIKLSGNINKVLLINHAVSNKSTFTSTDLKSMKNSNNDSIRTNEYFNGLYYVLANSPRFENYNLKPVFITKSSYNDRFKSLDWPVIEKLCNDSNADAAIVLENFQVLYSPKILLQYFEEGEYGYYKGILKINNSSIWKIYLPSKNKIEDDFMENDTLYWDGYGNSESQILDQLPQIEDAILESCYYSGSKYGQRILQTWDTKNRYLIYSNRKDFVKAYNLAKQDKWEEASELWKKYPYGKNKRLAALASYNLAVACETLDHIDLALEWAAKSYFIKKNSYTAYYIRLLERRKAEKDTIESQFN